MAAAKPPGYAFIAWAGGALRVSGVPLGALRYGRREHGGGCHAIPARHHGNSARVCPQLRMALKAALAAVPLPRVNVYDVVLIHTLDDLPVSI